MSPDKSTTPPASLGRSDAERFFKQVEWEDLVSGSLQCSPGRGRYHRTNGTGTDVQELVSIGRRPPRGLCLYKYGSRSVVGAFELKTGLQVCLKYYFPRRFYKHVSYGMNGSRCRQSWMAALAFARAGIPTPAPLAMIEWKRFGGAWLDQAFLATRRAEGLPLGDFATIHQSDPIRLERLVAQLRKHFSTMARYRIVHGDLKANNILVHEDEQVSFLDLDAATVPNSFSRWKQLRERDQRVFAENWQDRPALADLFRSVFEALG